MNVSKSNAFFFSFYCSIMCVRLSNTRGRLNAALGIQQKIPLSFHPATWFNITEVWESARGPRVAHVWACTGHRGPGRQRETERQRVSGWDRNLSKMTADWRRAGDPADTLVVFWCYVSPAPSCSQPSININQNDIWRQEFSSSCSFFFLYLFISCLTPIRQKEFCPHVPHELL